MKPVLSNRLAERVVAHVSARSGVSQRAIKGCSRRPIYVKPRHRVIRLLTRLGYTSGEIAIVLNREPSTVRHALRKGHA